MLRVFWLITAVGFSALVFSIGGGWVVSSIVTAEPALAAGNDLNGWAGRP